MGYYITLLGADFAIPETEEVLQILKDANTKYDAIKRGGSFGGGKKEQSWFSWMDADYDKKVNSVADVFAMLGFEFSEVTIDGQKYVQLEGYDNKAGQEDLFLSLVAPFVRPDSFMIWRGEDGNEWRYGVENGRLMIQQAMTEWGTPAPHKVPVVTNDYRLVLVDPNQDVKGQLAG